MLEQEDCVLKASLGCTVKPCLKKPKPKPKPTNQPTNQLSPAKKHKKQKTKQNKKTSTTKSPGKLEKILDALMVPPTNEIISGSKT
jgi:hypothetical protein